MSQTYEHTFQEPCNIALPTIKSRTFPQSSEAFSLACEIECLIILPLIKFFSFIYFGCRT